MDTGRRVTRKEKREEEAFRLADYLSMAVMAAFITLAIMAFISNNKCSCAQKRQERVPRIHYFQTIPDNVTYGRWT